MKKYKVVFKNGDKLIVNKEIADGINRAFFKGTLTHTSFTSTDDSFIMSVSLLDILYIIDVDYKA